MVKHFKLVRDLIPFIIEESGYKCSFVTLDDYEYLTALEDKLKEEVDELLDSIDDDEFIEEVADVLEVINALCDVRGISLDAIEDVRASKERKRGGFCQRIYLLTVDED